MKIRSLALCVALLFISFQLKAQNSNEGESDRRYFVGSSAFMIANLLPNPPSFYQMNVGYRLTGRDVISVEVITWTYDAPLGIPFGPSKGLKEEAYPGYVREYGVGIAYQRFLWKGVYAALHATPFRQTYIDEQDRKIQNGFQLFLTVRIGYQVNFYANRLFIEPSVAFTHWPVNTNVPEAFSAQESKWPNYFIFEPGLHFGIRF